MSQMVAALYVERGGVYWDLHDVDPWDEARDARLYAGPWPVVAHPPCSRWGALSGMIQTRYGYAVGDDEGCFEAALYAVRVYGGVLEHPAHTRAFRRFHLPIPMREGWTSAFGDPGASAWVDQGWYGHALKKPTWLYAVNVELPALRWGVGPGARLPHRGNDSAVFPNGLSETQRVRLTRPTPPRFRDVLLATARSAALQPA